MCKKIVQNEQKLWTDQNYFLKLIKVINGIWLNYASDGEAWAEIVDGSKLFQWWLDFEFKSSQELEYEMIKKLNHFNFAKIADLFLETYL
jgi:hypothetical protein